MGVCNKHVKDIDKNIMLSVIIPVYNAAKYLDECIRSVVSQTYNKLEINKKHENFHIKFLVKKTFL